MRIGAGRSVSLRASCTAIDARGIGGATVALPSRRGLPGAGAMAPPGGQRYSGPAIPGGRHAHNRRRLESRRHEGQAVPCPWLKPPVT